jgi:triosephosphate isomerase
MARRKLIAGNWKLYLGPHAAAEQAAKVHAGSLGWDDIDLVLFPTALSIPAVRAALRESTVAVGLQWAHAEPNGAFTGTNSATIARELGCAWLLAGHSEVRRDLGETDERVNASVRAGLAAGLLPMICVGETLAERQAGALESVLERQLRVALSGLTPDQVATCALAYEPVWAIGTGLTASPAQAQEAHAFIRGWLRAHAPAFVADQVRVLYGGSVKPSNAAELLALPDVDGLLIGGASLKSDDLLAIAAAAR